MSRFDVKAALARIEAQEAQREAASLVDYKLEATVLGNMLGDWRFCSCSDPRCCNPAWDRPTTALEVCDDVELDDFSDFRYRRTLQALRNVQESGVEVPPCSWPIAVSDEIERTDKVEGRCVAESVNLLFLTELVLEQPRLEMRPLGRAAVKLRALANLRRLA